MNVAATTQALLNAAQLVQALTALVNEARGELSSSEEAQLQNTLAELRAANDAAYEVVQAKLAKAAEG